MQFVQVSELGLSETPKLPNPRPSQKTVSVQGSESRI